MNITRYPQRLMKYGVVSRDRILKDLHQWTDMYGAGRLHKPVKILQYDEEIENAITINRENAVRTGTYLLTHLLTYLLTHSLVYIQHYYYYRASSTRPMYTSRSPRCRTSETQGCMLEAKIQEKY
jgi:hypothetical protein